MLASVLLLCGGCASTKPEYEPPRQLVLQTARGIGASYPCAVVGVVASTHWHRWQDPCNEPLCMYHLAALNMLTKPGERLRVPTYRPGRGTSPPLFLERHEESSSILFVRGHNAVAVGGYWTESGRRRYAAYGVGQRGFYREYYAIRDAAPSYDAEFVAAEDAAAHTGSADELVLELVPLYVPAEGATPCRPLVNHSMLLFLLGRADLWKDLQAAYREEPHRAGVILVCQVVCEMAEAHQHRWPDFELTPDQRRVLGWCRQIAADAGG